MIEINQQIADALKGNNWPSELQNCGRIKLDGDFFGEVVGIEHEGNFVWFWREKDKPDKLAVISNAEPSYVDMTQEGWQENLAEGIKRACDNPGKYVDSKEDGRKYDYKWPDFNFSESQNR